MPPSIYGQKGLADLCCCRWGVTAWVEVKSIKGQLSDAQRRFGEQVTDAGGVYVVARSIDFAVQTLEHIEIVVCDSGEHPSQFIRPNKSMWLMSNGKS